MTDRAHRVRVYKWWMGAQDWYRWECSCGAHQRGGSRSEARAVLLREPDRSEHEQVWADALAKIESIQAQLRAGRWARDDRTSRPP